MQDAAEQDADGKGLSLVFVSCVAVLVAGVGVAAVGYAWVARRKVWVGGKAYRSSELMSLVRRGSGLIVLCDVSEDNFERNGAEGGGEKDGDATGGGTDGNVNNGTGNDSEDILL